ncbi:alpha-xylosidase [Clostridium sp. chh4-2]|uniref:glycoside hydrolase family 31 protein n=1 Tax=Clostridium sp. chh4-2 TaxID=2067550 RepID=UPI000CCFB5A9|nr:glycoside hydrolase family 31 protein [Clostridium sp. chh4-2]PNV60645.1 alpha-xylosidase [Clostridium sp. chh4-2]
MAELSRQFRLDLDGSCNPECVVQGDHYRFTILTPEMVRMEYSEDGEFEDAPTQVVWNRNFDKPEFTVTDVEGRLEISTKAFHLVYNKKEFTPNNLYIDVKCAYTNYGGRWLFGATEYGNPPREHNLKGTARTLDRIDGPTKLDFGLLDTSGRTFFDDSESLLIDKEGWVHPRKKGVVDYYYLGYGRNYFKAIHDFYQLSGAVPMLPKYVLGNWWSRYWKYTEQSYMELLKRFESMDVPFSVVVMDMDWHIVDVPEEYGRGWTGYTWNKDFFPDPKRFMGWLHDHNYKITLNLHPADGVMPFEDAYEDMARELGVNIENNDPVHFDVTSIEFLEAYFKYLHHPNEEMGVDFWWMDWQQGKNCAVEGLDPLWMLNHYHVLDLARDGKRGVLLSRYGGLGSHRYPIGFSGDAVVTWKSLEFQPYFTATASNVGYTWWSHDIGGHMGGYKDNELVVRWMQFGIFSPINRLHSNCNPFCGKEPWRYPEPYCGIMVDILKQRHQLVPYIYTLNYRCHNDLVPVIIPTYYYYPDSEETYVYKNQYFFGSELMVCPITSPTHKDTSMASVEAWIPAGLWTDLYTGFVYHGGANGKRAVLNRTIDKEPVLGRAGGIVPMAAHVKGENSLDNAEDMEVVIFPGASGSFDLFEDEGDGQEYLEGKCAFTRMNLDWSEGKAEFCLKPEGDLSVIPENRSWKLIFRGFNEVSEIETNCSCEKAYCEETRSMILTFPKASADQEIRVVLKGEQLVYDNHDLKERAFELLDQMQIENNLKRDLYQYFVSADDPVSVLSSISAMELEPSVLNALVEILVC